MRGQTSAPQIVFAAQQLAASAQGAQAGALGQVCLLCGAVRVRPLRELMRGGPRSHVCGMVYFECMRRPHFEAC